MRRVPRWILWVLGILAALVLVLFIISFFLDEPLRRSMEKNMNRHLKGYSVRLPGLHFQLIGLSVTLKGLTVSQQAHPKPPVAEFPVLKASIHWRDVLHGRMVAEFNLDRPKIHVNLLQLKAEAASKTPMKERGWQQALEDIYPLKINHFTVAEGDVVYIDQDPKRPLHLAHVNMRAENIRNVWSADKVYPSSFHLDTVVFEKGRATVDGNANFLAEPIPGVKAAFGLDKVPLDYFKPIAARYNVAIKNGELMGSGDIEYAPKVKTAHVKDLTIKGMDVEYVHKTGTAAIEKKRAKKVGKAAGEVSNKPGILLRLDELNLTGCTIGMRNKGATPPYRVFLADTSLRLTNLSNQFMEGPAEAHVKGKFMGSGATTAIARFRPEKKGPDFDLDVKIKDTRMVAMNDLLRAYGKFDVTAGFFSFYSELHIRNNAISGYVKPLFREMKVYDKRKDEEKSAFKKMYEMLVGGVAKLLENRPRGEVATKAEISGPLKSPKLSTLQIIGQLIKNAFFKAILPGFEREVSGQRR